MALRTGGVDLFLGRFFSRRHCKKTAATNSISVNCGGVPEAGTRFELVVQNNPYGSLANCWFQPLTHPSGNDVPETPAIQAGLQRYIFLLSSQEGNGFFMEK